MIVTLELRATLDSIRNSCDVSSSINVSKWKLSLSPKLMNCWASAVKTNCTRETKLFLETRALCIIKIHLVVGDIGVSYAPISVYLRWLSLSVCQLD